MNGWLIKNTEFAKVEDVLKGIADEQLAIYQRALNLKLKFITEAKAYRKNNNYMFYEPNVKNVNDVTIFLANSN